MNGQAHGRGIYTSMATSHCFDGYWYCDMRHGKGVLTSGSKDYIYEGRYIHAYGGSVSKVDSQLAVAIFSLSHF